MNKPKYKQTYIEVPMVEAIETRTVRRQIGTRKVRKQRGLLKPEFVEVDQPIYDFIEEIVPTGKPSDVDPDLANFSQMVEDACNALHDEGYDVISVEPVLRGMHRHEYNSGSLQKGTGRGGWGYGYGYSLTAAFIIIGKLRDG